MNELIFYENAQGVWDEIYLFVFWNKSFDVELAKYRILKWLV